MGIWDAFQWTADNLQRVSPDLAPVKDACRRAYGWAAAGAGSAAVSGKAVQARELLHSATDKLRLSAPDLAPVAAAVSRMDHAVRVDGVRRVKEAVPDRDGWERIGRIAWNISDHALGEITKPYTGGLPAYKIVKEGWAKDRSGSAPAVVHGKERELQEMRNKIERMEEKMKLMEVDNFGTVNLVDACRKVGVKRFILISSILVNGAAMGQIFNPAYVILNVLGLTLIAKLQAEQYIRRSGINYTIIRPGGLRDDPPTGNIVMEPEDTLYEGSISRDQVAEVAVEALFCSESFYKVAEIVSRAEAPERSIRDLFSDINQK